MCWTTWTCSSQILAVRSPRLHRRYVHFPPPYNSMDIAVSNNNTGIIRTDNSLEDRPISKDGFWERTTKKCFENISRTTIQIGPITYNLSDRRWDKELFYINYVCLSSKNISIRNTSQNGQEAIRNPVLNGRGVNKDNLTVIPLPRATSKQCNTTFGLKIAHINVRLLRKIALSIQLRELAISNNIDVLTISETWFNSTVANGEISTDGYNVYRLAVSTRREALYMPIFGKILKPVS